MPSAEGTQALERHALVLDGAVLEQQKRADDAELGILDQVIDEHLGPAAFVGHDVGVQVADELAARGRQADVVRGRIAQILLHEQNAERHAEARPHALGQVQQLSLARRIVEDIDELIVAGVELGRRKPSGTAGNRSCRRAG